MSPPKFLPNLSTDSQQNATFGAKNTNPHTAISKPGDARKMQQFQEPISLQFLVNFRELK